MISIIVPHHKESIEQMNPLLSSLDIQQGIDFKDIELLIINDDKSGAIRQEAFAKYKNIFPRIKQFFNEKAGYMGVSRQIGIDNALGEYAIFCDADDMIYSATILYDLMTRSGADVYSYQFVEEMENHSWIIHEPQFTWMFAKLYKLEFIRRNNVRFSDTLLWHEDTYFNQVLLAYKPVVENLGYIGYLWKYSHNSITRKNNGEYTSKSMCMYIDALDQRLDRIGGLLREGERKNYIINDIVYIYSVLQDFRQVEVLDMVRDKIEERLLQYIRKHDAALNCLDGAYVPQISERLRNCVQTSLIVPREGFWEFIQRITKQGVKHGTKI